MSATSTEKTKPISEIIRDVRDDVNRLTEDDRDIIILSLETVGDLIRMEKTSNWKKQNTGAGYLTPGGNPVYECESCGFVYGAHEIFPSAKICRNCGRLMLNGRRKN